MKSKNVIIGLVGFGNIGSYFYRNLEKNKNKIFSKTGKKPIIKYICAKNINKKRKFKIPKKKMGKKPY